MISNKKLFLQELKRNAWVIAVLFLLMLFAKPVMLIINFERTARFNTAAYELIKAMEDSLLSLYSADIFVTYASAVLLGLTGFSFVLSKSKVDMYHSIPISRSHRFIINYVTGFIIFIVLFTLNTIMNVLICMSNHFLTAQALENILITYFATLIHFIYSYSLVIAAVMLTGNIVVCFAAIGVLSLGYLLITEMILAYKQYFFVTHFIYYEMGGAFWRSFPYISPVASNQQFLARITGMYDTTAFDSLIHAYLYLLAVLIPAVIVTIAAYFLYKHRASEAAGKAIAFNITKPFVKIPLVILTGLFSGYMLLNISAGYDSKWLFLGALAGTAIMHCVMEIIFSFNFKAFYKNKIHLIICLAATVFIILIFEKDLFGYDYYIPKKDKIEAAGVLLSDLDTDLSYAEVSETGDGFWRTDYRGNTDYAFNRLFYDEAMIDKIYTLSQAGIASVDGMKEDRLNERYGRYTMDSAYETITAVYNDQTAAGISITGGDDGPTAVFIARQQGSLSDTPDEAEYADAKDTAEENEKLQLAKQYMSENGIEMADTSGIVRKVNVRVYYRLKNNSVILRSYSIPLSDAYEAYNDAYEAYNDVYKTKEYKRAHYNIYDLMDKGAVHKIEIRDTFNDKQMVLDKADASEFLKIYTDELESLTLDDIKNAPVGAVSPLIKTEYYDEAISGYYIYPTFKRTLKYMADKGVNMEFFTSQVDADKLAELYVYPYSLFEKFEKKSDDEIVSDVNEYPVAVSEHTAYETVPISPDIVSYSKEADEGRMMIEAVAPYLTVTTFGYNNAMFVRYDERYDISVLYDSKYGVQKTQSCKIYLNDMPKELLDDLIVKMYEYNMEKDGE